MTAAHLALWLFVVILGIAFGAGLYEHRIATPRWITRADGVLHWDAASTPALRRARFNHIRHLLVLGGWLAALREVTFWRACRS